MCHRNKNDCVGAQSNMFININKIISNLRGGIKYGI